MKILFLHGLESSPGGRKSLFLQRLGHHVVCPRLPPEDFDSSVKIAQSEFDKHEPDVVIGSSRGGAVGMSLDLKGVRLVLIAPAWRMFGVKPSVPPGTIVLHCENDEVVAFKDSKEITGRTLVSCGSDHRMSDAAAFKELENTLKKVAKDLEYEKKRKQSFFVKAKNSFYSLLEGRSK